jgi:hypothetical protein
MDNTHYCTSHNTPFYKNEKNGKVWFSHKTDDPAFATFKGYHNEPKPEIKGTNGNTDLPKGVTKGLPAKNNDSFHTCNSLNNTVALIVGGKVELKDLEPTYKRLLKVLEGGE